MSAEGIAPAVASAPPSPPSPQAGAEAPLAALVVGYGSPIRGDDAIGPLVADRLVDRLAELALPGVEVQARHILTAELVADLRRCRRAVFLDAAADAAPGEVRCRRIVADATAMSTMAHFHDPRELLAWCEALYGESPEAWLVTAGGAVWDYSYNELSPAAAAAVEPMLAAVLRLVNDVSTIPPCP